MSPRIPPHVVAAGAIGQQAAVFCCPRERGGTQIKVHTAASSPPPLSSLSPLSELPFPSSPPPLPLPSPPPSWKYPTPAATTHPVPIPTDRVSAVTVGSDWGDISPPSVSSSTPVESSPHPSTTNLRDLVSASTEATSAPPANAKIQIEQARETTETRKIQESVPSEKFRTEKAKLVTFFDDVFTVALSLVNYQKQQLLEHQTEIEGLEKEVDSLKRKIWELQSRERQALALLQLDKRRVAQLLRDIGKLSLGVPPGDL